MVFNASSLLLYISISISRRKMLKTTAKRTHGGKQKEKGSGSGSAEEMATLHIQQAKIFLRAVKRLKEMHQLLFFISALVP